LEFTEGTFCGYVFCAFATLSEMVCGGFPGAAVFVFAISARAFNIAEVSCAGARAGAGCGFSGMKSFGGVPSGVVEMARRTVGFD